MFEQVRKSRFSPRSGSSRHPSFRGRPRLMRPSFLSAQAEVTGFWYLQKALHLSTSADCRCRMLMPNADAGRTPGIMHFAPAWQHRASEGFARMRLFYLWGLEPKEGCWSDSNVLCRIGPGQISNFGGPVGSHQVPSGSVRSARIDMGPLCYPWDTDGRRILSAWLSVGIPSESRSNASRQN